uniref:Histone-binding protein RBBP4 n=1 Tax=Tetraselmis sp. GSL018 TaxID=582737 RepID=A0A061QYU5_9CHLO
MAEDDHNLAEEYNIWRKNTPFLYDLVIAHALEWPSLTVQWLPEARNCPDQEACAHKLLLGTHTADGEQNYVMVAEVLVPEHGSRVTARGEIQGSGIEMGRVSVSKRGCHDGEVNRARYCPQRANIVATKTVSGDVCLFDMDLTCPDETIEPHAHLKGHKEEGYGLCWNPIHEGRLISGSNDGLVCLWDAAGAKGKDVAALSTYSVHKGIVGDVSWHASEPHTFASGGEDCCLVLYDARQPAASAVVSSTKAHSQDINCVAFHPTHPYLIATGSADKTIGLLDSRKPQTQLHSLGHHTGEIYQLGWNPHKESVLASSAEDRRLMLWDLSKVGMDQSSEDAEDGPPELLFMHGGHLQKISDFGWHTGAANEWTLASVDEDNILQIYSPAASALMPS